MGLKLADYDVLQRVAKETGFDFDQLSNMYFAESSVRSDIVNPKGYVGGFQFGKDTGEEYGLVGEGFDYRKDLKRSAHAAIDMTRANLRDKVIGTSSNWSLSGKYSKLGIDENLAGYLAHQQGRKGFIDIITGIESGNISESTRTNMLANIGDNDWSKLSNKELSGKFLGFWKGRYAEKVKEAENWRKQNIARIDRESLKPDDAVMDSIGQIQP